MKETKVYVDELPKNCLECPFCEDIKINAGMDRLLFCNARKMKIIKDPKKMFNKCIIKNKFIALKTHDRELVKEVCEKIKEQLGFIVDGQERIVCDGSATGDKTILAVLKQIQKEYEK